MATNTIGADDSSSSSMASASRASSAPVPLPTSLSRCRCYHQSAGILSSAQTTTPNWSGAADTAAIVSAMATIAGSVPLVRPSHPGRRGAHGSASAGAAASGARRGLSCRLQEACHCHFVCLATERHRMSRKTVVFHRTTAQAVSERRASGSPYCTASRPVSK